MAKVDRLLASKRQLVLLRYFLCFSRQSVSGCSKKQVKCSKISSEICVKYSKKYSPFSRTFQNTLQVFRKMLNCSNYRVKKIFKLSKKLSRFSSVQNKPLRPLKRHPARLYAKRPLVSIHACQKNAQKTIHAVRFCGQLVKNLFKSSKKHSDCTNRRAFNLSTCSIEHGSFNAGREARV